MGTFSRIVGWQLPPSWLISQNSGTTSCYHRYRILLATPYIIRQSAEVLSSLKINEEKVKQLRSFKKREKTS